MIMTRELQSLQTRESSQETEGGFDPPNKIEMKGINKSDAFFLIDII